MKSQQLLRAIDSVFSGKLFLLAEILVLATMAGWFVVSGLEAFGVAVGAYLVAAIAAGFYLGATFVWRVVKRRLGDVRTLAGHSPNSIGKPFGVRDLKGIAPIPHEEVMNASPKLAGEMPKAVLL